MHFTTLRRSSDFGAEIRRWLAMVIWNKRPEDKRMIRFHTIEMGKEYHGVVRWRSNLVTQKMASNESRATWSKRMTGRETTV
jgi:hypothetical protein